MNKQNVNMLMVLILGLILLGSCNALAKGIVYCGPDQMLVKPEPITFNLEKPGNVSVAIYDLQGRMVREIARAETMKAGQHIMSWDGLDMDGNPVSIGKYEWRILQTEGLRSEYLMSIGTSVNERFWPGNHNGPAMVATAENSVIVGAMPEGVPLMTRVDFKGNVVWERGQFEPARSPYDIAVVGNKVFYLQDNGKIFVLNLATGQPIGDGPMGTPLPALFPVKTFVFGKLKAKTGETQVPLRNFNTQMGCGWDKTEGMLQNETGMTCDALEPRVFEATIPNGKYLLRYHYGDDRIPTTLVEVHPNGLEPSPGHYTLSDKMAWWQLQPSLAAAKTEPIFLPQLYQLPRAVEVKDTHLHIRFIPESPRTKPVYSHWGLRKIEVIAVGERIAGDNSTLVLSSRGCGKVMWVDPLTGRPLDTVNMTDVRDVAIGPKHVVFALLKNSVVSFMRENKHPRVIFRNLVDPVALDVDTVTGSIFVADGGNCQQVKCFNAGGQLIAAYGRSGGRKLGRYESRDFSGLSGIACDGQGGFVVTEQLGVPRRTARFDSKGRVLNEWFGGMDFYTQTSLDPGDPTLGWIRQDDERVIQVKMDYVKRKWRPIATYRWTSMFETGSLGTNDILAKGRLAYPPWFDGRVTSYHRMRTLRHDLDGDGKPELLLEFTSQPLLLVHDEKNDRLRPLACMGLVSKECFDVANPMPVGQLPIAWVDAIRKSGGNPADVKSRIKFAHYSWADENGDGLIDANELILGPATAGSSVTGLNGGFCVRVDTALNAWIGSAQTDKAGIYRLYKPLRITTCGAPVWPLESFAGPKTSRQGATKSLLPTTDGGLFAILSGNGDGMRSSGTYDVAVHGWSWPTTLTDGMALLRFDSQGNRLWRSGSKAARWPHPRGQLFGAWHLGPEINGCIPVFDWTEQPCEFWTTDGLYIGGLFDGRDLQDGHDLSDRNSKPDRLYTWVGVKGKRIGMNSYDESSLFPADDMRTGGDVGVLPDKSVIFIGQGGNNNPCYRIKGFDNWVRMSGVIAVNQDIIVPGQKGTGLKAEYFNNKNFTGSSVLRNEECLWFGINKPWPGEIPKENFSARWSGFIEPRFSEEYCISVYARGEFKMWIDGKEIQWAYQDYPREVQISKGHSLPIRLRAGERVSLKIEYCATMPDPSFHLNWESLSQPVEHIPTQALYEQ